MAQLAMRLCIALAAVFACAASAPATVIKDLEFNIDGNLPSSEPDMAFYDNTGFTEGVLYTTSGGLLHQRTLNVTGSAGYAWPDVNLITGTLDPTKSLIMEARLRILSINGVGGAFFQAFDGVHRFSVFFEPNGVQIPNFNSFSFVPVDVSQFHTYMLETPGSSNIAHFYIDDNQVASVLVPVIGLNGFDFGDGISASGNGADVDWDYIRVFQDVPEPTSAGMALLSLLSISALSRRTTWR